MIEASPPPKFRPEGIESLSSHPETLPENEHSLERPTASFRFRLTAFVAPSGTVINAAGGIREAKDSGNTSSTSPHPSPPLLERLGPL